MPKRILVGLIVLLVILGLIIWFNQPKKSQQATAPVLSVSAFNQSKNVAATSVQAREQDVIVYTLTAENQTSRVLPGYVIEINIADTSNKATLIDANGASYNAAASSLVWTALDIPANGSIQKQFSVRVNPIPVGSNSNLMSIKFNNQADITLASAPQVAGITASSGAASNVTPYKAPKTGPNENLVGILALIFTVCAYFFRKSGKIPLPRQEN